MGGCTGRAASTLTRVAGGVFAFAIIGLGVPIFSVLMRYNLVSGGFGRRRRRR